MRAGRYTVWGFDLLQEKASWYGDRTGPRAWYARPIIHLMPLSKDNRRRGGKWALTARTCLQDNAHRLMLLIQRRNSHSLLLSYSHTVPQSALWNTDIFHCQERAGGKTAAPSFADFSRIGI